MLYIHIINKDTKVKKICLIGCGGEYNLRNGSGRRTNDRNKTLWPRKRWSRQNWIAIPLSNN